MKRYLITSLLFFNLFVAGCVRTSADSEECYAVEEQRCEMRGRCYREFDVAECKYYYKEQCRARNIVPSYTEKELEACVKQIHKFGDDDKDQCDELKDVDRDLKLELCEIEDLDACQPIACEEVYGSDDGDDDDDDDTSGGLNP